MASFGVIVPYGVNSFNGGTDYQVRAVRATEAAARKLARPVGSAVVEFSSKPRPRQILSDRGVRGTELVKTWLPNPPAAKRRAKRAAKRPAKRATKRATKNPRYEAPPLDGWALILQVLNDGGRARAADVREAVRAVRQLKAECAGGAAANPPRDLMSRRVLKLYYVHAGDGREYVHDFAPGVSMYADGGRRVVLERPDGKALSQNF